MENNTNTKTQYSNMWLTNFLYNKLRNKIYITIIL